MKSTGVVRRVDELGRIVIPKEIRRTMRIRDGESLEIFVDNEGISLKKISQMSDLNDIAQNLVDVVHSISNKNVFITDRDKFIAGSGDLKKRFLDKNISHQLETIMNERHNIIKLNREKLDIVEGTSEYFSYIAMPIIVNGDAIGLVLVLSIDEDINKTHESIVLLLTKFLGKYVDE